MRGGRSSPSVCYADSSLSEGTLGKKYKYHVKTIPPAHVVRGRDDKKIFII